MKISKRKKILIKTQKNKHQNQQFIREVLLALFKIMIKLILIIIDL